jgi:hypothetical protein
MTEYVTGQIYGWNGGKCPVHPKTVVNVWYRNGKTNMSAQAVYFWWKHPDNENGGDIVCFQVVKPYAEPKVIWVNEYEGGGAAFYSEEEAKEWGREFHTRLAAKYVEVK